MRTGPRSTPGSSGELVAVVLAALIPAAFYAFHLGLYIDDWGFRWALRSSADQSWTGLYATLAEQSALAVRPLQIAWLVSW